MQLFARDTKQVILSMEKNSLTADRDEVLNHGTEILLVLSGEAVIAMNNGDRIRANEGDVLYFDNINERHIASYNSRFSTLSVIFVANTFINGDYHIFSKNVLDRFYTADGTGNLIPAESRTADKIQSIMFDVEEEFSTNDSPNEFIIKALVLTAMSYIVRHYQQPNSEQSVNKIPHHADITKTMVYINNHLSRDISLDELAKIANMSKSYYSSVFKKVTGMRVWEYIVNARIELAISYLTKDNTQYSITEILGLCGFNTASSFNKTFKKVTGKTPSDYKKANDNPCF